MTDATPKESLLRSFNKYIDKELIIEAEQTLSRMYEESYPRILIESSQARLANLQGHGDPKQLTTATQPTEAGDKISDWEKRELRLFGKCILGPALSVFYKRLFNQYNIRENQDPLFFLSREGYFLKKGFDQLSTQLGLKTSTEYLLVSRALLFRLLCSEPASYELIFTHSFKGTLEKFLVSRCGLTKDEALMLEASKTTFSQGLKTIVTIKENKTSLESLLRENKETISRLNKPTLDAYLEYLSSIGFLEINQPDIIDVGYSGTIQKAISLLLRRPMSGHYMVTTDSAADKEAGSFHGYLFNQQQWGQGCAFLDHSLYLEAVLTAPTGSAIGVKKVDSKFKFAYGPTTKSQQRFDLLEEIFTGAIDYCSETMHDDLSLTPLEASRVYTLLISSPDNFPDIALEAMELEDEYSGLGTINPLELYHA